MDTLKMVFLFLFLFGCALPNMAKPGVTAQVQKRDQYQCYQDSLPHLLGEVSGTASDRRIFQMCMEARGYARQD